MSGGRRPCGKYGGGNFIGYDPSRRFLAVLEGNSQSPYKTNSDSKTYKWASFPERRHEATAGCPPSLPREAAGGIRKLPTGFRYAGDETRGSEFAESNTGDLEPTEERAAAA